MLGKLKYFYIDICRLFSMADRKYHIECIKYLDHLVLVIIVFMRNLVYLDTPLLIFMKYSFNKLEF